MYSEELLALFKRKGISVGDRIRVKARGMESECELMPSTDVADPGTLILKLDSGYNIGIRLAKDTAVERIGRGIAPSEFPRMALKASADKPKVTLVYTGGTIGSKIDYKTGGVYMLMKPEELLYVVPELQGMANIEIKNPFSVASEDLSYIEWQQMAKAAAQAISSGSRGVVITMGTDTMHYTSAALSFMLGGINAPVVITGAQRSSDRGSSDAFVNLDCAVRIAAQSDIAEVGVCMHASSSDDRCQFIRGTRARKMHTSRRDAFRPINDKPIAYVSKSGIEYANKYNRISAAGAKFAPRTDFEGKVALVKSYPNADPGIIDFYVDRGYKGLIIEGTGLGHVSTSGVHKELLFAPRIESAIKKGVIVGVTSQCLYGRVHPNVYRNLRVLSSAGAVYCEDMLPEVALVKLGWLLGNYDKAKARELLNKNLVGEISARSEYGTFLI